MPIKKPGKILGRSIKLKHLKNAGGHGKAQVVADLNVTPMVDMLVMLVIYLLMTFSASGEILFVTPDIVLPPAFNADELERAPVIAISPTAISFEGQFVMNTAEVTDTAYSDWKLTPIAVLLDAEREAWTLAHVGENFNGNVIIQSDDDVTFSVLKMIISTCAKSQYINMNFAIQKVGRSEAYLGES